MSSEFATEEMKLKEIKQWARFAENLLVFLRDTDLGSETINAGVKFAAEVVAEVRIEIEKFTVGNVDGRETVYYDTIPF